MDPRSIELSRKEDKMIKELIKLANYLDSKDFTKEANDLDRIIKKISEASLLDIGPSTLKAKVAAIIDDSLKDFQGYLRLQDGMDYDIAGEVSVDDEDGAGRLLEKLKEIKGRNHFAQAELVSTTSDGHEIGDTPISLKDGKLYLSPHTLASRGDNLLQLISGSPHWNISDSEALNENLMNITEWPDLDVGRVGEHIPKYLWSSLGKEAQKNPSGLQDFVDGFMYDLTSRWTGMEDREILKEKSGSFIRGYFAARYAKSEGDPISDDPLWQMEATPTEKAYHKEEQPGWMSAGEKYQQSGGAEFHEELYSMYANKQLDKIFEANKGLEMIRRLWEKLSEIQNTEVTKSNITSGELIRIGDKRSTLDKDIGNYMMSIIDLINLIRKADSLGVEDRVIGAKLDMVAEKLGNLYEHYYSNWVARAERLKHVAAGHLEAADSWMKAKQNIIEHAEAKGEPIDNHKDAIEMLDKQTSISMGRHQQAKEVFQNTMQILPGLVQEISSNVLTDKRELAIELDIESN
jgi:hypothetical protein